MAAITSSEVVYQDGRAYKFACLRVCGVTTGDTIDLSSLFKRVVGAQFVSMTGGQLAVSATLAGLVATFANTGMTSESGFLLVVGSAAL